MTSVTLGFTVAELFKVSMVGRAEVVATVARALIVGLVLPSGVKVGALEGVLEKMLYKFLGEGLVSVEAFVLRGIVRPPSTLAVAGVVTAESTVPATSACSFLEEVEGPTLVPRALPTAAMAMSVAGVVKAGAPIPAADPATVPASPTTDPSTALAVALAPAPATVPSLTVSLEVFGKVSLAAFPVALLVSRVDLTVVLEGLGLGGAMLVAILGLAVITGGGAEP